MTDQDVRRSLDDWQALAVVIFGEAAAEPVEGKIAVGCVIRNRVQHPRRYGQTYRDVATAQSQFSCLWKFGGPENFARVMSIARSFTEHTPLPLDGRSLAVFQECSFIAEGIIGGQLQDTTRGATHYYNPKAMKPVGREPEWAHGLTPSARIGSHLFYAGVK